MFWANTFRYSRIKITTHSTTGTPAGPRGEGEPGSILRRSRHTGLARGPHGAAGTPDWPEGGGGEGRAGQRGTPPYGSAGTPDWREGPYGTAGTPDWLEGGGGGGDWGQSHTIPRHGRDTGPAQDPKAQPGHRTGPGRGGDRQAVTGRQAQRGASVRRSIVGELYRNSSRRIAGTLPELYRRIVGTLPELYRNSTGTLPELFQRIAGTLPEHFQNSTGAF